MTSADFTDEEIEAFFGGLEVVHLEVVVEYVNDNEAE